MRFTVADLLDWADRYTGEPFHALLSDMPYHLTSIVKRFGSQSAASAAAGPYARTAKGFMGKDWDGGDLAFRPETWHKLGGLLYPGAFGMAFAGSRGWHRMATAIEDAGLIIHPTIFCWAYGSGFPKATRIDSQLDRAAGAARPVVAKRKHAAKFAAAEFGYREKDNGFNSRERSSWDETGPATPLAQAWAGHRYGLQAIRPAVEPIIVFQRPYEGRPVDNISQSGAGALNIDAARIARGESYEAARRSNPHRFAGQTTYASAGSDAQKPGFTPHPEGGWPANLVLCHHPGCEDDACHPDCNVLALGAQSGERPNNRRDNPSTSPTMTSGYSGGLGGPRGPRGHSDEGTAARYFFRADWMLDRLEAEASTLYYPKPTRAEKEAGLDPLQIRLMRDLYGHEEEELPAFDLQTIDDGRKKPIDNAYLRGETERLNTHPTIKPLSLNRHLATLLRPPALYAPTRLLVPCSGTGSELIGALLAGWDVAEGIELEAEHVRIAEARLDYWRREKSRFDQGQPIRIKGSRKRVPQQESLL